jgi:prophage DNA circulation protein
MVLSFWRLNLQPASFNGAVFHIAVSSRQGGRRQVEHEFPKKEDPFAEDMGRRARGFNILGYVIGADFEQQRDALIEQLELEGNGTLVLPTYSEDQIVVCDVYSVVERREHGGYAEIEMRFLEAGQDPSTVASVDTQGAANAAADQAGGLASSSLQGNDFNGAFMNSSDITQLT